MAMRIALLADDTAEADLICGSFNAVGHFCRQSHSGSELMTPSQDSIDMVIVSGKFSGASTLETLSMLRHGMPEAMPILLVASRSDEDGIVAAMGGGANDYIVRPVRRGELLTRAQVLLQRAYPDRNDREQIRFGQYIFETGTGQLSIGSNKIDVTQKEFELALLFFRNLGRPLSRAYILDIVWSREGNVPSRTLDTHVSRVRGKLHLRPENGFRLTPVYSYGYRLEQLARKS